MGISNTKINKFKSQFKTYFSRSDIDLSLNIDYASFFKDYNRQEINEEIELFINYSKLTFYYYKTYLPRIFHYFTIPKKQKLLHLIKSEIYQIIDLINTVYYSKKDYNYH